MSKTRDERRKAEREAERKKAEEIDRALEGPRLLPFEKPATGKIIEPPPRPPAPKK
jgi:hypothetical protein